MAKPKFMKNIIVCTTGGLIALTMQEVMGVTANTYLRADSAEGLKRAINILDPEKPDLIMVAGKLDDAKVVAMIDAAKEFHDVLVIMDMNSEQDAPVGDFQGLKTYPRTNAPNSPFFVRCREILGE